MSQSDTEAGVTFSVPGPAAPQGSKRAFRTRSGRIALVESSNKVKPFRAAVAVAAVAAGAKPIDGAVAMRVAFIFMRPASHFTRSGALRAGAPSHPGKPDLDKLARAVGDALTGVCYRDDSQIVRWEMTKRYGAQASTEIAVFMG